MAMEGQLADLAGATQLSKQLQNTRNQQALANWQTYLAELTAAKVTPPAAATIKNPFDLPSGLLQYKVAGAPVPGAAAVVAAGRPVRVLSAETIRAVNQAFSLIGKPYGVGGTGPDKYGCLGAARAAWQPYTTLAEPRQATSTPATRRSRPRSCSPATSC